MASNNIEHIVIVGTSFTAGGGYEEGGENKKIIEKYEKNVPKTQEECSWPAFFQKLINPNIKVHNLARSGSGIDYMIRTINEWISKNPSKIEQTMFLLEISGYGRMELWDTLLDRNVVCNWDYGNINDKFHVTLHSGNYWREPESMAEKISSGRIMVQDFLNRYCEPMIFVEQIQSRLFDFLCKLNYKEIDFKVFGEHLYDGELHSDPLVDNNRLYLNGTDETKHCGIHQFIEAERLQIKHITQGESDDFHACLEGNRQIAEQYYNQLRQVYNL